MYNPFVGISPIHAQDYDFIKEEKIQLFEVNLTLEENTDVRINERIYYYFPFLNTVYIELYR